MAIDRDAELDLAEMLAAEAKALLVLRRTVLDREVLIPGAADLARDLAGGAKVLQAASWKLLSLPA